MKTLGYIDKTEGQRIYAYVESENQNKNNRIQAAYKNLMGLGHCYIVLIWGNKHRIISSRSY